MMGEWRIGRHVAQAAGLLALTALGGCASAISGLYGSAATEPQPTVSTPQPVSPTGPGMAPVRIDMDVAGECPEVTVMPGTSSYASYAGGASPASVRYQASISQFARECILNGNNTVTLKVGVEGRFVIGEKGSPGTFSAPLNISVRDRDEKVVFARQQRVSASVPSSDSDGRFRVVDDSIVIPISLDKPLRSYDILVGFGDRGLAPAKGSKGKKKKRG